MANWKRFFEKPVSPGPFETNALTHFGAFSGRVWQVARTLSAVELFCPVIGKTFPALLNAF